MQRLMVLCVCGERIQVPRSALGKTGLCPACGRSIVITAESAMPMRSPAQPRTAPTGSIWNGPSQAQTAPPLPAPSAEDDEKRRFAEAVDLYFARRYSEALAIFNALGSKHPDNPDVQMGQSICLNALRSAPPLGLEYHGAAGQLPSPNALVQTQSRAQTVLNGPAPDLNEDVFKRFLMNKMLYGATDDVQMRAAELAARMFGYLDGAKSEPDKVSNIEELFDRGEGDRDSARPTPMRRVVPGDDAEP